MSTIAEIVQMTDKTVVNEVRGTLVVTFNKTNQRAPSKGVLKDDAGAEIQIEAWGHPDLGPMKGKSVLIKDDQGGMTRLTNTYGGKNKPLLNLNKTSIFQLVDGPPAPGRVTPAGNSGNSQSQGDGQRFGMCFKLAGDYYKDAEFANDDDFVKAVAALAIKLNHAAKASESA